MNRVHPLLFTLCLATLLLCCVGLAACSGNGTPQASTSGIEGSSLDGGTPGNTASGSASDATVQTQKPDEQGHVPGDDIERIEIEALYDLLESGADVAVIDARNERLYEAEHIQGAVSLPWKDELSYADTVLLPRASLYVVYCECGPGEADAADFAWKISQLDVGEVKALAHPSIEGWVANGYPTESGA